MSAKEAILKTLNMNTTKVALAMYEDSHHNSYQNPCSENEGQGKVTLNTAVGSWEDSIDASQKKSISERVPHLLLTLTFDRRKIPTTNFKSLLR